MNSRRIVISPMQRVEEAISPERSYEDRVEKGLAAKGTEPQIDRAIAASIEDRATKPDDGGMSGSVSILPGLIRAGELISPWWSYQRDSDLRKFVKQSDHLGGAMFAITSKISNINFKVLAADPSVRSQVQAANFFHDVLMETPEYGDGWQKFIARWVDDENGQDNGAFAQIIGRGRPDGPIVGAPISLSNLDSSRCLRTSNPVWPVIYQDTDGKRYRLHYTRVMFSSQMPSTQVEMNSVGFCSISRAIGVAQNLVDISRYKQEKLGSRPPRQLLVGRRGITVEEIFSAFAAAYEQDSSANLSRYRRMVAIAPKQGRGEVELEMIDLASVPDGFNEQESTTLGMFTIALAFGMDAREIWPATASGATKADAMLSHLKARGKGPGRAMQVIERQMNQKFLPDQLTFQFDFQDDEQDAMQAEIRDKRSQQHERDLKSGSVSIRVTREIMLSDGDISESQFEQMELEEGRLPSGDSVLTLFFSTDPDISSLLSLSPSLDILFSFNDNDGDEKVDPLTGEAIETEYDTNRKQVLKAIDAAVIKAQEAIAQESWSTKKQKARQSLAALEYLREKWEEGDEADMPPVVNQGGRPRENTAADTERRRNEDSYRGDGEITAVRGAIGKK